METALSMVIVFTVVVWILEVCGFVYTYSVLANAANEGVRYAIAHNDDLPGAQAKALAFASLSLHSTSGLSSPTVTLLDGSAYPPNRVRVTVTYVYVPWIKFVTPTMTVSAEGRFVGPLSAGGS